MKKIFLVILLFSISCLSAQSQNCPHPSMACLVDGQLSAYVGDSIVMSISIVTDTIPTNTYSFSVNTCNATIVAINSVSFNNSLLTERIIMIAQNKGSLDWTLTATDTYPNGCVLNTSCGSSCTVIDKPLSPSGVKKDTIADLTFDIPAMKATLQPSYFYVGDTTQNCGYYSNGGFQNGWNWGIGGYIILINLGDQGKVNADSAELNFAYMGIPNVTPHVTKDACNHVWYDGFCWIKVKDLCGNTISQSRKFSFSIVTDNSGYALRYNYSTGKYSTTENTQWVKDMLGIDSTHSIDTTLAHWTESNNTLPYNGAVIAPNAMDTYDDWSGRNATTINNDLLNIGEKYIFEFTIHPEVIGIHQGANLAKDTLIVPFTWHEDASHVNSWNPDGYWMDTTAFAIGFPTRPDSINVSITKGKNQTSNGELVTWSVVNDACSYNLLIQTWMKGTWHTVTNTPLRIYGNSYPINLPAGQYMFAVSASNISLSGKSQTSGYVSTDKIQVK